MTQIYWIRHGEAEHNLLYKKIGEDAYKNTIDSKLTPNGIFQSHEIKSFFKDKKIDKVFVSPLTRTIQTANIIFPNTDKICIDSILEYPQGIHMCNKRKNKSELVKLYPNIDFQIEEIREWKNYYETKKELSERVKLFRNYIKDKNFDNIAVVTHNSYVKNALQLTKDVYHCIPILEKN